MHLLLQTERMFSSCLLEHVSGQCSSNSNSHTQREEGCMVEDPGQYVNAALTVHLLVAHCKAQCCRMGGICAACKISINPFDEGVLLR